MDPARLRELASRYTAAWCSQDAASVAEFFARNGSQRINDGPPAVGRAAIAAVAQGFMTSFPDLVVTMDGTEIRGDHAVYRWTLTGTNTGPGGTGRAIRISGSEEWTLAADGSILESKGQFDQADYRRQLAAGGPGEIGSIAPAKPIQSGHAPVHGIRMYYEVHGRETGGPLVLLHGGGSTIEVTFSRVLPHFAAGRRVIAVEEQGHGRTTDRDAPVTFETSADDVAALLRDLKVDRADLFGFSNGASVGLQVAIRHPQLVRKLVLASTITRRDGATPQLWEWIEHADFSNMPQPLKDAFLRVNPDEQQLRTMHDKDAARMRGFQDIPDALIGSVRAPTLIVIGDRDIVKPEHALELTRLIPGARLLVLPGGHGDWLGEAVMAPKETRYPELTVRLIEEFLDSR